MLYTLDVTISDGPITGAFTLEHPAVTRTIQIRGNQTLDQLHRILFKAFNRFDPHLYEFRFGDKYKVQPDRRYVVPEVLEDDFGRIMPAGVTTTTTIADLDLQVGSIFHYWFDFGDDWWHWIEVKKIVRNVPRGRYPKIVGRIGASPPQYVPLDDEALS